MLYNALNFNQQLAFSSTGKVTDMIYMFFGATDFNSGKTAGDPTAVSGLKDWDTSAVTSMYGMFFGASDFNEPIRD